MRVYIAHSKSYDFRNELYKPIRSSRLNEIHEIVLPHEKSEALFGSKSFFQSGCDVIVVEASHPKIGIGIEVGWADAFDVPTIVMHKKDSKLSSSIKPMSKAIIVYESAGGYDF